MKIVHFTNSELGSIEWELPPKLAMMINTMSEAEQKLILEEIETHLKANMHLLLGALYSGPMVHASLRLLRQGGTQMATALMTIAKNTGRG